MQLLPHQEALLFCRLCPSRDLGERGCGFASSQRQGQPGMCTRPVGGDGGGLSHCPSGPCSAGPTRARALPGPQPQAVLAPRSSLGGWALSLLLMAVPYEVTARCPTFSQKTKNKVLIYYFLKDH